MFQVVGLADNETTRLEDNGDNLDNFRQWLTPGVEAGAGGSLLNGEFYEFYELGREPVNCRLITRIGSFKTANFATPEGVMW